MIEILTYEEQIYLLAFYFKKNYDLSKKYKNREFIEEELFMEFNIQDEKTLDDIMICLKNAFED